MIVMRENLLQTKQVSKSFEFTLQRAFPPRFAGGNKLKFELRTESKILHNFCLAA